MQEKEEFTRYEVARILGARALQISMDAPMLLKISDEELRDMRFDALKIAEKEFTAGVLPISVKRPMPRKIQEKLHVVAKDDKDVEDEKIIEKEKQEEKEIVESAEEMGFENVQDEDYAPVDEESVAAAEE